MGFTYAWSDAIEIVRAYGRQIPVDKISAQICDSVSAEMWGAFPWRDSCTALPPFALENDTQDYSVPPLIFKMVSAQIARLTPGDAIAYEPLVIKESLPLTYQSVHPSQIHGISLERGVGQLRLSNRAYVIGDETFEVSGVFQMKHQRVVSVNQDMWFDDQLYHVAQEGLLYWGYKLADRAADAKAQYMLFRNKLKEQAMNEDIGSSDVIYPAEGSIGTGSE